MEAEWVLVLTQLMIATDTTYDSPWLEDSAAMAAMSMNCQRQSWRAQVREAYYKANEITEWFSGQMFTYLAPIP